MGDRGLEPVSDNPPGILPAASCPRCGYDLEGIRATWKDSCPLAGVCSECGYEFEWANLLRKDRQEVRWLYDNARRWWSPWRAVQTLAMTLWPYAFWKRVPLHTRLAPARWVLWPIVLLAPLYIFCILCSVGFILALQQLYGVWPGFRATPIRIVSAWTEFSTLLPVQREVFWRTGAVTWKTSAVAGAQASVFAFNLVALSIYLVGSSHWSATKIRPMHFVRASVYGMAPALALAFVSALEWAWGFVPTALWVSRGGLGVSVFEFPEAPPRWLSWIATDPGCALDELVAWVWLLVWWWAALRRGIQVRQVAILWLAAMLAGTLIMIVAATDWGTAARALWGI